MNKVLLTGNVTAKYDNGTNVRITIADNYKDGTNFVPITLFDQNADFVKRFVNIGDHIYIEGAVSSSEVQDAAGKKKSRLFIQCWRVGFEGYRNPNKDKNPSYSEEWKRMIAAATADVAAIIPDDNIADEPVQSFDKI